MTATAAVMLLVSVLLFLAIEVGLAFLTYLAVTKVDMPPILEKVLIFVVAVLMIFLALRYWGIG